MIKLLNASYARVANLKRVIKCKKTEELNGEYRLDFEIILDNNLLSLLTEASFFEVDNDIFDPHRIDWLSNADGTKTVKVEAEHVSYLLNDELYHLEYFAQTGTPSFVLGEILDGTNFTAGSVDYSDPVTYSIQEKKSRRQILMEFIADLGGEIEYDGFNINIRSHRGSTAAKPVLSGRNVKVVSKSINKRELDDAGDPKISYGCTPIYLPENTYELGDDIVLLQSELGIAEALRVVRVEYNPYNPTDVKFTFSNYMNGLENSVYKILTETVVKDKLYNGCRIGPEYGFEVIRSDNNARAFFRSDGFKIQKGDGTGINWDDVFYVDADGNIIMQGSIQILDVDGAGLIIDNHGIDPKYIDYSKNLIWNSGFEVVDSSEKPFYWSDGIGSLDSSLYGSRSLKLANGVLARQHRSAGIYPNWVDREIIRVSFYAKFTVDFKVRVVDIGTWVATGGSTIQYYTLTDEDGNTGTELQFTGGITWEDTRISISFDSDQFAGTDVRFALEFENVDVAGDVYIDGVMAHIDFTGKWPQLYKQGPRSEALTTMGDAYTDTSPLVAESPTKEFNKTVISDTAPEDLTALWVDTSSL